MDDDASDSASNPLRTNQTTRNDTVSEVIVSVIIIICIASIISRYSSTFRRALEMYTMLMVQNYVLMFMTSMLTWLEVYTRIAYFVLIGSIDP